MKDQTLITITAIACTAVLEFVWILKGHNHSSLSLTIGAIGAMAGFQIQKVREK